MFGFFYGYILAPTQNPAQHLEKIWEKVAETAEIPKTASKTQLKIREKVAETAEIPKTAPKTQQNIRKRPGKK